MTNSKKTPDASIEDQEERALKVARGERLTRLRGMTNLSRADIAKKYGISVDSQNNWEIGRQGGLTEKGAKKILEAFKNEGIECSMGWLFNGIGAPPAILTTQNTNALALASSQDAYAAGLPQEVRSFYEQHPNGFYFQVTDDSMEPYFFEGDYVAGERLYQDMIEQAIDKHCIVETQPGQILLRRLRQGSQKGKYSLQSINFFTSNPTPYLFNVELTSAAPVTLHWRTKWPKGS